MPYDLDLALVFATGGALAASLIFAVLKRALARP